MANIIYGQNVDFAGFQSLNQVIQNLSSAPGSPAEGQVYFDTTLHQFGVRQNSTWVYLSTAGSGDMVLASVQTVTGAKTFGTIGGAVGKFILAGSTSGSTIVNAAAVAGSGTMTLPTGTDTLAGLGTAQTWTGVQTFGAAGNVSKLAIAGTTSGSTVLNASAVASGTLTLPAVTDTVAVLGTGQTWTGVQQFGTIGGSVGKLVLAGSTSGSTILNAAATAGSGTMTLPTGTDTLAGLATAQTWTGVQTFGAAGNVGKLAIAGTTSGSTVLNATATASGTLTLPATTDTLVGKATTDTFTNKTFDAAGTGNVLSNIATSMFASNVIDTDGTLAANSNTRIASQAAVVTFVNANIQGVRWKAPVRAATTAAGTLATSFENGDVIDGVTLATGDRILIKDQSSGSENGIYTVNASGAPTRATDADTAAEVLQFVVSVQEGTLNADKSFVNSTNAPITLNTTALTIVDFVTTNVPTASTTVAGKVQLADSTVAEAKSDAAKALTAASVVNFPIKKVFTVGNGSLTDITVTHNLGTKDVHVSVRRVSDDALVLTGGIAATTNTYTVSFGTAPASNAMVVTIIG